MSNTKRSQRRDDILNQPVGRQLVKLTVPMLFALISIFGLGFVDSYFISFLGTNELAAIGFIAPVTYVVTSFALGLGMAISSLNSKLVGAGNMHQAARLITDGFYLTAILAALSILLLRLFSERIFASLGADQTTVAAINDYMVLWTLAVPLIMFSHVSGSTFRSLGDTSTSAIIAIVMTLSNIVFDPLLIFGLGPFPKMGMAGAALATLLSVALSAAVGLYYLGVRERLLLWAIPAWRVLKVNFNALLEIGIPAVLANSIVPLTAVIVTTMVANFGVDAVAGYGVGMRIEGLSFVVVYALSSTLPMFIGQHIGADRKDRIYRAMQLSFRFVVVLQIAIYVLLALFAQPIAELFSNDESVHNTIKLFIYTVPLSYGLAGIVILINVSMNVLGKPKLALYINIIRMLLFYVPLAYFGGQWLGLNGLFAGLAIGNLCAFILAKILIDKILREQGIHA